MGNAPAFFSPVYCPNITGRHCCHPGERCFGCVTLLVFAGDAISRSLWCDMGPQALAPHSSLLTQTQSKEKASAKLPPAPAVAAGRQWELGPGDSHTCPWLMVKELAQNTMSMGRRQNPHPGGSLLLIFKVPMLVHVSQCQFRADITSESQTHSICHLLGLSLLAPSWCTWMVSQGCAWLPE